MLLLTACAQPVIQKETEYVYPPSPLVQPCPAPDYQGETWGELAEYTVEIKAKLEQCDSDKAALREWANRSDQKEGEQ